MDSADLFRHVLTTKILPEETITDYEFRFDTVFYNDGGSYCYCRCAYDHEYLSYISESGDIDWEKCDTLVQAIKDGKCQHASRVNKKRYLSETRVNVFHIAAVLGSETLSQLLLSRAEEGMELKSGNIESGLFRMYPFGVAALRGNAKAVQLLFKVNTTEKNLPGGSFIELNSSYSSGQSTNKVFVYAVEKDHNIFQITNRSVLEVCIVKGHKEIVKMFLENDLCQDYDGIIYEHLFKYNLADMLVPVLSCIEYNLQSECDCIFNQDECIFCEHVYGWYKQVRTIAELAVIYNVRDIFNKSIQLLCDASLCPQEWSRRDMKSLFEICRVFQRNDFQQLFSANERQNLCTKSISETQLFDSLYRLLKKYTLSGNHIESVMKQIQGIQRIVNAPLGDNIGDLTPLQISIENLAHVSVVRTLVDLGADIDQMIHPKFNFDPTSRCTGKTILMYILSKDTEIVMQTSGIFFYSFRGLLELLLYENVSLALNDSAVSLCLRRYRYRILDSNSPFARQSVLGSDSDIIIKEECPDRERYNGIHIMDSCVRESALFYTVPLLIEVGFKYTLADIEAVLFTEKELIKAKDELKQRVEETNFPHCIVRIAPNAYVSEYLKQCLSTPRSLKLRCRDVLRSHYPRRQIHRLVSCVDIPVMIQDFLLLKPILNDREFMGSK